MAPQTPSNPDEVLVIRNVTPNIVTLSLPFSPFGGVKFGGRGTMGMFLSPPSLYARWR
ncbi:hypothetical protein BJX66DRAFT_233000 [Aspergillus keveii]|uniref:Uncharacterized protein n=1 Tax=Aspergillus keveii TaxID=714993 RepID=A0ABR4G1W5_9EURO